jgi:ribosomal protein L7/L12
MAVSKEDILEAIGNMTVLELSQLIKDMEEKFGVSAAAATVAVAAPAASGAAAPAAEEAAEPAAEPAADAAAADAEAPTAEAVEDGE